MPDPARGLTQRPPAEEKRGWQPAAGSGKNVEGVLTIGLWVNLRRRAFSLTRTSASQSAKRMCARFNLDNGLLNNGRMEILSPLRKLRK